MLVNKDSAIRLAINSELWYFVICLAKLNKSLVVASLRLWRSSLGIRNVSILYPRVYIADKVGQNLDKLLTTGL